MELSIYNQEGKAVGKVKLPEDVFNVSWNDDLVHSAVVSMMSNKRSNTAHAKDRSEVRGGGSKPWRQKGTGRARHGSTRSPIWVGGGVTHGPNKEKNYSKKINKKEKVKALYAILSRKLQDKEILFIDSLNISEPKAKTAKSIIDSLSAVPGFESLSKKRKNAALIALGEKNEAVSKSFRNFGNIKTDEIRNVNPLSVLQYKYLIISNPELSFKKIPGGLKNPK